MNRFIGSAAMTQIAKGRAMKRLLISFVLLLWTHHVGAAERIRIGYSSISGAYIPIWVAHDAGYFAKEGLEDQIVLIPSGTQLAQVTVAGEIDVGSLNRSSAMAAALQGADLKIHARESFLEKCLDKTLSFKWL
jgi:ABC-type nitrate/sulfonate/bicarbonate transport system substrate-binding protein